MANIRGKNKGKGDTTSAVRVGAPKGGGIRGVARPSGYAGRTATSGRGGMSDAALGANNRGSGGKGAPGTGVGGGRGSAGGSVGGGGSGLVETTTNPGATTPTPPRPTSGRPGPAMVDDPTIDSTFASAMPLSSQRTLDMNAAVLGGAVSKVNAAANLGAAMGGVVGAAGSKVAAASNLGLAKTGAAGAVVGGITGARVGAAAKIGAAGALAGAAAGIKKPAAKPAARPAARRPAPTRKPAAKPAAVNPMRTTAKRTVY